MIKSGNALSSPSQIAAWDVAPGGNPTVLLGRSEIDFRLLPRATKIFAGYYIYNTDTQTEVLRDDDRQNWISDRRYGSIALDVAGDSDVELITVTPANNLRCLARDGSDIWNHGGFGTYDQLGCPALYDLDRDGNYEVILGHYDHSGGSDRLLVLNAEDGSTNFTVSLGGKPMAAPVVGDVDDDGEPEIIIVGQTNKRVYSISPRANGTIEWQSTLPDTVYWASPIMGDFDADGLTEVVIATDQGRVCYLSGQDGSLKRRVDIDPQVQASPVAADIDDDGYLEVIVAGVGSSVHAIQHDGTQTVWPSDPSGTNRISTPAIADTNGDGVPEVVCVDSHIRVFDCTGEIYSRSPGSSWIDNGNSPVIFDSNNNGLLDIVYFMYHETGKNSRLYRVSTTTSSSQTGWKTFKNDFRRSGIYGSDMYGDDPDLVVSNHNWTYGNISKGSTAYKDFKITNVGTEALTGTWSTQGKIDLNGSSSISIPEGTSRGFRATFDTSEKGNFTANIIIETNDPDEPVLNLVATANVTQPEQDLMVHAIHAHDDLNPNYVPPVKVEFRNLGQWNELSVSTNLTIDGTLCDPITADTFDMAPGEAVNVTFLWNRTTHPGTGSFLLRAALQNANFTNETDVLNNVLTKTVNVHYPVSVEQVTSYVRKNITNLTYLQPSDNFTEADFMNLKVVLKNQWSSPVTLIPAVNVVEATGPGTPAYGHLGYGITLDASEQRTVWPGWYLGLPLVTDTKYNATVTIYDSLGGGVTVLNDPYVHTFWVEPSS